MPDSIAHVGVVVPARDEVELVAAAVEAVLVAADRVDVPVEVVVVANGCTDGTADAARRAGATVLELAVANVGAARAAGVARALAGQDPVHTWVACTDADSMVPEAWLVHHLSLARAGADAVLGTVTLPDEDTDRHVRWLATYRAGLAPGTHPHVHGANLGVRGSTFLQVGGFAALAEHEDADLVRRLELADARLVRTHQLPVTTSARTTSRVGSGVAADLRALSADRPGAGLGPRRGRVADREDRLSPDEQLAAT